MGWLGPIEIEGTCGTAKKTHTVNAEIKAWSDCIDSRAGEMGWRLELSSPATSVPIRGKTFVELYQLLRAPVQPMYGAGLPAEVMRFLCQKPLRSGPAAPQTIAELVTFHLFHGRKLMYETTGGGSGYDVNPILPKPDFAVADCALRREQVVNCYDQAASVQSMCGAVGVKMDFVFMLPFGYISANLIGVGRCNNPFFRDSSGVYSSLPYVRDPKKQGLRSAFYNHAFDELAGKVFDACAGPHRGTETRAEYIKNAIDHDPALNAGTIYPGTEANARPKAGITGIDPKPSV